MNIRYFFVADCVERGHITIKHCPTEEMISDFFNKPLSGAKFRRFRNIIMNCNRDEYGPVDTNAVMAAHHRTIEACDVTDVNDDEPRITTDPDQKEVGSQECVGKRTRHMWAAIGKAHKNKMNGGQRPVTHAKL